MPLNFIDDRILAEIADKPFWISFSPVEMIQVVQRGVRPLRVAIFQQGGFA